MKMLGRVFNGMAAVLLYLVLGVGVVALAAVVALLLPLFVAGLVLHVSGRLLLGLPLVNREGLAKLTREKLGNGF
jgi:hypothetical protein